MRFSVLKEIDGHVGFYATISKLDLMAADRIDKLLNYIMMRLGNMVAAYYFKHHKEELLSQITEEMVSKALADEFAKRIKITLIDK